MDLYEDLHIQNSGPKAEVAKPYVRQLLNLQSSLNNGGNYDCTQHREFGIEMPVLLHSLCLELFIEIVDGSQATEDAPN